MAEPIEWQILQNLQSALRAIAIGSGYHFDVQALAVKLDPNQNVESLIAPGGPRPFIVIELRPESWEYFPASEVRLVLPWTVHWVHESTPTSDDSRVHTYLRGCADIERAIAIDLTRGGLAIDTRIVKREFEPEVDGSQVWAMVDIQIALRRSYGQPDAA